MSFTWPLALVLLLGVPAVLTAYLWQLRRRRRQAVRYSSVALLRSVLPRRSRWRRHVPVGMLLASLAVLGLASARPQLSRTVALGRTTIVLALDVSGSMCATDVEPNRMTVAQQAARDFIRDQPAGTRTGLVVFSGFAQLAVSPTTDRDALLESIEGLTTARGTAIGAAMLKGIDAIAEVNPEVEPVGDIAPLEWADERDEPSTAQESAPPASPPPGGFVPDIVVLLTDGANTQGIAPLEAVAYAVERGVRVYTIGFGTPTPTTLMCTAEQLGARIDAFGRLGGWGGGFGGTGRGFDGLRSALRADEASLRKVAERTGGAYFAATDAAQLQRVFADLPKNVELQKERNEITVLFVALAALLAGAALTASLRWSSYP